MGPGAAPEGPGSLQPKDTSFEKEEVISGVKIQSSKRMGACMGGSLQAQSGRDGILGGGVKRGTHRG